jgi:salicylate hydroxylase
MSDAAEKKYGAPQLTIHRADLLSSLQSRLPADSIHLGMGCKNVEQGDNKAVVNFLDDTSRDFDLVIGADGVHSCVRAALFGKDDPKFTGIVSYRAVFQRDKAEGIKDLDAFTKWWGEIPEKQIVTFPLTRGEEIFVFATIGQDDWTEEGWTLPGDVTKLRSAYANFHPEAQALLAACTEVTCSALHVREPMELWSRGNATIMGDAAHPMVPFMAQGACMAIEDAVILARALDGATLDSIETALTLYEEERRPRTAKVQIASLANEWMKKQGNADWVYGYDAWGVEL